jgi:gliding motility-associated-like protein
VNGSASSGSFYSGFPSNPEINFDTTIASLGNCIPNMTLEAANTELFDTFEWYFDDEKGGGFISTGITETSFKPTSPGKYKLKAIITCTMTEFESIEIPVSICPDDFDGDLIIDNLDDDIDNDGILNCDESIGNATLNIANINNPSIVFLDSSTNNSTTSIYTETEASNSFSGDNLGNFESVINPATDTKLKYELKFAQNINFKLTQNKSIDHTITDGEYFILKIGPNNKNITLLDPDDQLLIDTNFDGEFETGVTYISASEIWFKYAANTTGVTSTFQFVANQVNQIDFKHQSTSISTTSTFNGNIQLTCFSLDSDGDGIENMFDLDSDNDGIPDFYETAIDTDSDGILNYLDLDSDNDGIYDSTEAGHNLDTDFDGIIDNAATTIGINGLVDNLEITPDDKTLAINYTITDTDSDGVFNFLELDSDNDLCFDVTEAGFTGNSSGILSATPFNVDDNGKIINNVDGYTNPNANYTTYAPITLNTPFNDVTFCENSTEIITIDSTADGFQWQVSTDGSTWSSITDNTIYNGANTTNLQLSNIPLTYNNYQYRVLLSRIGNSCTKQESSVIVLTLNPLAILKTNPELDQCISDTDTNPTINLTNAEINISETANVTFKYFEDAGGLNEITSTTAYPVIANTIQSVFVIVTSDEGCSSDIVELKLNVGQANNNNYNDLQTPVCDDFLDADGNDTINNSDTDNITNFYLDKDAIIASINPDANTNVFFYENSEDRNNTLNEIDITNYRNDITKIDITTISEGIQFPIYYKLISTINNNCQGLGQFYLQINSTPIVSNNSLSPIEECDTGAFDGNYTNGSNRNIDLTQKNDEIFFGTSQDENDFDVTFYKTEIAANSGDTASLDYIVNPTQFTNDIPSGFSEGDIATQSIFVRVQNIATGCVNTHASFQVIINPLPIITSRIPVLEVCDMGTKDGDVRNGLAQNIDVSVRDLDILNGKSAANFTITYHKTQTDLEDLASTGIEKTNYDSDGAIINPTTKISEESLFIRILNNNTGCIFDQSTLTIVVNPEPNSEVISNLSECDNNDDGDNTNGIIQTIDLNGKISEILGSSQDTGDFTVTFHANSTDASTGDNKLNSPYENTNSTETIYVRIQNKTTLCVNDDATFDIIINSLPNFTVTTPQILCLNNLPLNIAVENPTDNYSYIWTNSNRDIISTDDNVDINLGGTYTVFATTTNGTMCTRTETIIVNESNIAVLEESFITIIDESNNISSDNNISISIDTLSNDLGPGDYQFAVINDDNGDRFPSFGFQDEPLFENLEGGIYTIIVNDKNGCSSDTELQISVIQFPKFFTPNSDGKNDTWVIKGANKTFYPNSSINIFNRYGKLVAQVPIDSQGWNGTYNGKTLPSDDYWFNIQLIPADTSKSPILKKGHFSLLRK